MTRYPLTLAEMMTLAIAEAIVDRRPFSALRYSTGEPVLRHLLEA